jgi:cytochrome c
MTNAAAILALAALALGSQTGTAAADGAAVFQANCTVCHSTEPGTNKLGPSLAGIVGRKAGALDDYSYSPAMAKSGITWDQANLDKYLTDPQQTVPGTKMLLLGIKSADDRKDLIQYLGTLQ